jgi:hypothetical protein
MPIRSGPGSLISATSTWRPHQRRSWRPSRGCRARPADRMSSVDGESWPGWKRGRSRRKSSNVQRSLRPRACTSWACRLPRGTARLGARCPELCGLKSARASTTLRRAGRALPAATAPCWKAPPLAVRGHCSCTRRRRSCGPPRKLVAMNSRPIEPSFLARQEGKEPRQSASRCPTASRSEARPRSS